MDAHKHLKSRKDARLVFSKNQKEYKTRETARKKQPKLIFLGSSNPSR